MRLPDGKPRGFGYVTLDSSEAASACLAVPQVVDGRVVDLKRAVPEGEMDFCPAAPRLHTPKSAPMVAQPQHMLLATPGQPTTNAWLAADQVACHYNLGAVRSMPPASFGWPSALGASPYVDDLHANRSIFFYQPPEEPTPKWEATHNAAGRMSGMSADAAEFVPTLVLPVEDAKAEKRAALGEITNKVSQNFLQSPMKVPLSSTSFFTSYSSRQKLQYGIDEETSCIKIDMDAMEDTPLKSNTAEISPSTMAPISSPNSSNGEEDSFEMPDHLGLLPSAGSADHAEGTCKRCNFFAKGRCQSGQECPFCHFPHQKQKISRLEKRERKAEWVSKQTVDATIANVVAPPPGLALESFDTAAEQASGRGSMPLLATAPKAACLAEQPEQQLSVMTSTYASTPAPPAVEAVAAIEKVPDDASNRVGNHSMETRYSREHLLRARLALRTA